MSSKSEQYYQREMRDLPPFVRWNFRRIRNQKRAWDLRRSTLFVCLTVIEGRPSTATIQVNITLSPYVVKRSALRKVLIAIALPPYRNYRALQIKELLTKARSISECCELAISYAKQRLLVYYDLTEDCDALPSS